VRQLGYEPRDLIGRPVAELLRVLLQNLLGNAWKYTGRTAQARIEFGCALHAGELVYFARDNGVGFDMRYAGNVFRAFYRLHQPNEFEGSGIGLASATRSVSRHGGRI
jgi:light-regulated signal transduction histidine kinase (bacteriophytochrome)